MPLSNGDESLSSLKRQNLCWSNGKTHVEFACVTNGTEWPVEAFEREIINEARYGDLSRSERSKAAYHASSHGFLRSRKTHVL